MPIEVVRIPALADNYVWLLHEPASGETVVVVRGGDDTDPVLLLVDADGVTRQPIEGLS